MTDIALPLLGSLAWIDVVLIVWFLLAALSVAYVTYDTRRNPDPSVMRWGWILVAFYLGPLAAGLYVLADKEPRRGEHEAFIKPLWKQAVGSTVHCICARTTGHTRSTRTIPRSSTNAEMALRRPRTPSTMPMTGTLRATTTPHTKARASRCRS